MGVYLMFEGRVATQRYACGPYVFWATLPKLGTDADQPEWGASANEVPVPGRFPTLEDAMRAALQQQG